MVKNSFILNLFNFYTVQMGSKVSQKLICLKQRWNSEQNSVLIRLLIIPIKIFNFNWRLYEVLPIIFWLSNLSFIMFGIKVSYFLHNKE